MYLFAPFIIGVLFFYSYLYFPYLTALAIGSSALFFLFSLKEKISVFLLIFFVAAAGFFYSALRYEPESSVPFSNPVEISEATGVFTSRPVVIKTTSSLSGKETTFIRQDFTINSMKSYRVLPCKHIKQYIGQQKIMPHFEPLPVTVFFYDNQTMVNAGVEAVVDIKINYDKRLFNPGSYAFPYKPVATIQKIYSLKESDSLVWTFPKLRKKLSDAIERKFKGDAADLVKALTIGDTSSISDHVNEIFRRTGLTHLLSVSGSHFAMLTLAAFLGIRFLLNLLPFRMIVKITTYLSLIQLSALIAIPFIASYFFISELTIPAYRSFVTIGIYMAALLLGRKGIWWNSLLFAAFVIELTDPASIFNVSFLLSFNAVMFIGLANDRVLNNIIQPEDGEKTVKKKPDTSKVGLKNHIYDKLKTGLQYLYVNLVITLAIIAGTLPITISYFYNISLISVVANSVVVPVVCVLAMPLIAASVFTFLLTGYMPFVSVISEILRFSIKLMEFFSGFSFAATGISAFPPLFVIVLYINVLYFFKNKKRALLCLILTVSSMVAYSIYQNHSNLRVTFLDVGQSDSMVIETQSGKIIVVDTGKTGRELESFLRYRGANTIEAVFLTHGDSDHVGGFVPISNKFEIKAIFDNGAINYSASILKRMGNKIVHLTKGDSINIDGAEIKVFHPFLNYSSDKGRLVNNTSLVFQLKGHNRTFLFTGDIEQEGEWAMDSLGDYLKSDVLKVAHHGSATSSDFSFLSHVSPKISVISVGKCNSYGHPSEDVIQRLNNSLILRTDTEGAVKITESDDGIKLETYAQTKLKKAFDLQSEIENIKKLYRMW
ncbi:MAG: DNA internalization-related competence protein ComEC/Rec2 [Nitrospirae bacterium]|nr:DNA internalization-related competence protein ComEC/Rec2 [Nitrospirota bacterium]MBF0534250.1 DNA internalization-related competence protein ComEC/Rec2 [Nitrospirota bacterium]MBF0615836.1 DNA internalization-related competence protein ComEC/Rec2 [Nitrospirota bacterium]